MTTTNELLKDLKKVKNEIKKIPSVLDYKKHGSFHPNTIGRRFGTWNNGLKKCFGEVVRIKSPNRPIINCPVCGEKTKNPKYCSKSCSAKINNSLFPKHPRRKCLKCELPTRSRTHYCKTCLISNRIEKYGEKVISDFSSTYARHKYQSIRNHAHQIARFYNIKKECPSCDYKNHVQLCHIKDIAKFDKNTKLKIVNNLKNLVFLCPNHHWDLGHGLLDI